MSTKQGSKSRGGCESTFASSVVERPTSAKLYCITSNQSRAIEDELNGLIELARDGGIRGLTYVISNRYDRLEVGSAGSHRNDETKEIGVLFKAAVALTFAD